MAAIADAFIFITIIGLIATGMFAYSNLSDGDGAQAKEYYDMFFAVELKMNDVFEGTDTKCVRMCDLIAAHISSDEGTVREYAERILGIIIPPVCDYVFVFEFNGRTMTVGERGGKITSQYSSEITIINGMTMHASLTVY
jgi:hypothetical protein